MMKIGIHTKFKLLVKSVLCMILCFWLITVLISWNRVIHFKNYVYMSHPMSSEACSNSHFTVADVELCFSNENTGIAAERYAFSIIHHKKDSAIARPQVTTIDTLAAFFTPAVLDHREVAKGRNLLRNVMEQNGGQIKNAFGVIRFSSPYTSQLEHREVELCQGGNSNSFVVQKINTYENASFEFWHEEDVFYTLLSSLRHWELQEYRSSVFRFSDDNLMCNTYYGLGAYADSTVVVQPKGYNSLIGFLHLLLASYDISKAVFDCSLITNEIDSTSVLIRFTESVEISEIENVSLASKNLNSLKFSNWGIPKSLGFAEAFYDSFDGKSKTIEYNGWDLINYKQSEALSFNVKFLESRTLQWVRLFFLTTVITYLLTIIVKDFIHLFKK